MIDYDKVMRIGKQVLEDMYHRGYFDGQKDMPHDVVEAYNDGYADAEKKHNADLDYKNGLEDGRMEAWECARKLCQSEKYGGLEEHCAEIFNRQDNFDVFDYSASEAIAKIKEYEEKERCKECKYPLMNPLCGVGNEICNRKQDAEIKVGDEVYSDAFDDKGIVTHITADKVACVCIICDGSTMMKVGTNGLHKTGRHFDAIAEVLEELRGEE